MQDQGRRSKILYTGITPKKPHKQGRFSYSKNKSVIIGLLVMLGLLAIVIGAWYVLRLPRFRMHDIAVDGAKMVSVSTLENLIRGELNGRQWLIFPRDSYFLLMPEMIAEKIKTEFPKIRAVTVKKEFANRLVVTIEERELWGIGCVKNSSDGKPVALENQKDTNSDALLLRPCFYLDQDGIAFEEVPAFAGSLLPVIYRDQEITVGNHFADSEIISYFEKANKELAGTLTLPLASLTFSVKNSDIRLTVKEGWSMLVARDRAVAEWVSIAKTLLTEEIKDRRSTLDYLDLRFGNKVFYKFKK